MNLLSNRQKAEICRLAREAWELHPEIREPLLECNLETMSATEIFNAWRHVEQGKACGKQSLCRSTSEEDYLKCRAHFEALCGREARAQRTIARHATEPRLVARWKLERECEAQGLSIEYAAKICRTQYRISLDDASEKQLWRLFYTVRNRGHAKSAKEAKAKPEPVGATGANDNPF
ncbi:hypothetical protein ASA1KI_21080 [Opitutales bacterium ASA1]|uniref:hypothetical protein n=1 Tax=Congregicoccus parvus TaxID=3081749 RepID=UPI002B2A574C|nr:hypothetical protein ASA1KI_21080 [Opitutales bacterium ASA1]